MALRCECNRVLEDITLTEIKKEDVIFRCKGCGRTYYVDLFPVENLREALKNTTNVKIVSK